MELLQNIMSHDQLKISVIMPSYLYTYEKAATDRRQKFFRAVDSFLNQTYTNKELIIVADGCTMTESAYKERYLKQTQTKLIYILRDKLFSGKPRNEGLKAATGDIITYLDTDDYFSPGHLEVVVEQGFKHDQPDWAYWSDFGKLSKTKSIARPVELAFGKIGTSCIAHLRNLPVNWDGCDGYGHDWTFIQRLINTSKNRKRIYGTGYFVCHVKDRVDV